VNPPKGGQPCLVCKTAPRMKRGSYCRQCATEYERNRRARNSVEINARQRGRYTPTRARAEKLRRYGITADRYNDMLSAQGGRCAICAQDAPLHVDHDHACCPTPLRACGACVRGLLCSSCNNGLGRFRDSPEILAAAANYLTSIKGGQS
jgi:hypothetical protein